jgi:hypothetical protein
MKNARFDSVARSLALALALATSACGGMALFGGGKASGSSGQIRKIAILPFAYRDAQHIAPCSLCPDKLVMAPTSRDDALLVTAFFHEAMTTYPRFSTVPFDTVARFATEDMDETAERLWAVEGVDAVLVGALLELRPRVGDPRDPEFSAGAAVYAALVEASTKRVLWVGYRDANQTSPPLSPKRVGEIISGEPITWHSEMGQAQAWAVALVREMTRKVR